MLKIINDIDRTLSKNITNSTVTFVIIILGLLYIFMIKRVSTNFLKIMNTTPSKVFIALLIAYLSCLDPILAVGLTTLFILSLQELQLRTIVSPRKLISDTESNESTFDPEDSIGDNRVSRSDIQGSFLEERVVRTSTDNKVKQLRLEDRDSIPNNELNPADKTLTSNVDMDSNYISLKKMRDAQSNVIAGVDPEKAVEALPNMLNAQGLNQSLNLPSGNDPSAYSASLF